MVLPVPPFGEYTATTLPRWVFTARPTFSARPSSFIAASRGQTAFQTQMRNCGEREGDRDERRADPESDALPVPIRVQPHEVARRRIEKEIALREEHVVEQQEQRLECEHRHDADER